MVRLWRRLRGCCELCGQQIEDDSGAVLRVSQINRRANRLTLALGRTPLAQTCPQCHQIIFEDEPGFVERYLLLDVV